VKPVPAAGRFDLVELPNGELLEGRILTQIDGYVELELARGGIVGFGRGQFSAVRRGAGSTVRAVPQLDIAPSDQWYLLHDGTGKAVGWLHSTVQVNAEGVLRCGEEWEFVTDLRHTAVSMVETAKTDLTPLSSYYRERVSDDGARHLREERIVEAKVQDSVLQVQRLTGEGRQERALPMPEGATFTLLALAGLRAGRAVPEKRVMVFDPGQEEIAWLELEPARKRTVYLDGRAREASEIAWRSPSGRNAEWLEGGRTVRREVNGPALFGVPCSAETAQHGPEHGAPLPGSLVVDEDKRFGLWLPNPAWAPLEDKPQKGTVRIGCRVHDASVGLVLIDHLAEGTTLSAAADAVGRWFAVLHPELRVTGRASVQVRGRAAIRLECLGTGGADQRIATVHVVESHGAFLALTCFVPAKAVNELAGDLEFVLRSVELEPQGIDPPLQEPLQAKPGR
jgi:hypothetical protein